MTRVSDLWWVEKLLPQELNEVLRYVLAVPPDKLRIVCELLEKHAASEDAKLHGLDVPASVQSEIAALLFPGGIDLRTFAVPHVAEALMWWESRKPLAESN